MNIRQPAVAGMFYPGQTSVLYDTVSSCLHEARQAGALLLPPKALVLPHAGYIYSGNTAARGYCLLEPVQQQIRKVVLLGPSHRVALQGIALPEQAAFHTPLGDIPLDTEALQQLAASFPITTFRNDAHALEHSLEVHLPFLQHTLDNFSLIPLVVGETTPQQVADVLNALWGGPETLIIISTDLSHFLPYEDANHIDAQTSQRITQFDHNLLGEEACGCRPLNGLLYLARQKNLHCELLERCNSGDTAGSKDRVVGYGAFALYGPDQRGND